jgi:hypothetical protein
MYLPYLNNKITSKSYTYSDAQSPAMSVYQQSFQQSASAQSSPSHRARAQAQRNASSILSNTDLTPNAAMTESRSQFTNRLSAYNMNRKWPNMCRCVWITSTGDEPCPAGKLIDSMRQNKQLTSTYQLAFEQKGHRFFAPRAKDTEPA